MVIFPRYLTDLISSRTSPIEIEQENVAYEIKMKQNSETFVEPATGNRELKADADGQQELPAFMQ